MRIAKTLLVPLSLSLTLWLLFHHSIYRVERTSYVDSQMFRR
jgi:hypothetical protein